MVSLTCVLAATASAQVFLRLDSAWQFIRTDMASPWEVNRPVKAGKPESVPLWTDVTLPHCFNAADAVSPYENYYQGAAWYRRSLEVSNPYAGGHTLLRFEGSGQKTQVYVGDKLVGSHVGGYDEWTVDITEAVRGRGQRIQLSVRCDNSRDVEMLPSDMSDFCLYGGLYRPVWLVYQPSHYLEDVELCTHGDTLSLSADHREGMTLSITDPQGHIVYQGPYVSSLKVKKPRLWDVDQPQLYTARIRNGEQTIVKHFGFRSYRFDEHGPFRLNGRRLLLRGTHRHEDHAGVGAAMTEDMIRHELKQIKQMGANFIRLGHYQQRDLVLQLCDSLGLLVWEEVPWCRGGVGGERYQAQARRMLTNMIRQHRHHPSIILWGLGNENDWPGDFSTVLDTVGVRRLMTDLNALAHRLDPTRLTTIRRCDFCADIVDVYSPSIWAGWYSRRFTDYHQMEQAAIDRYPRFLHAEWGGDSHAGRHAETGFDIEAGDRNGDWSESYIVRLFDWHLKEQAAMPQLTGTAFWTFKDFATPLRPDNPIPYVNQKGVVQRDGTPKESYYVFQSYWSAEPMLHIYGHTWPVRWGRDGERKQVLVYSNQPWVELYVNGQSQGRRRRDVNDYPAQGFHWDVVLQPGENTLRAVSAGGLTDEIRQDYVMEPWGQPARLLLSRESADVVSAELVDEQGRRCLDATDWIVFSLAGDGRLLCDQGTTLGSRRIQAANGVARIRFAAEGRCAIAAQSGDLATPLLVVEPE